MGRVKRARSALVVEVPETETETDQAEQEERDRTTQEEADAAAQLPTRAEAYIYRLDARTARYAYLDKLPLSEITTEILRDEYGGGKYEVIFRRPKNGRVVATGKRQFQVDLSIPPRAPSSVRQELASQPQSNGNGAPDRSSIIDAGILALFDSQQKQAASAAESQHRLSEMTLALFQKAVESKPEPIPWDKIFAAVSGLATTVVVPLLSRKPDRDPIEAARQIAELAQKNTSAAASVKDMLSGVKEILEIRSLVGDQEPPDPMLRMAEMFGPPVLEILSNAKNQQRIPVPRPMPTPPAVPAPAAPTPSPTPTADSTTPMWRLAVKRELPNLVRAAAADKDPELFGEFIAENMPENYRGMLRQVLESPTFVADTMAAFPDEMLQFPKWFESALYAFRNHVLGVETDDSESGEESEATQDV